MERHKYVDLKDRVESKGGEVHQLSSLHVSGERLDQVRNQFAHQSSLTAVPQMSGVAAILRFPLADELFESAPGGAAAEESDSGSESD